MFFGDEGLFVISAGRNLHHGRPKQTIADTVSAGELFGHGIGFVFVRGFSDNGLMNVRVKALANRGNRLNAEDHLEKIHVICGNTACENYTSLKATLDGKVSY